MPVGFRIKRSPAYRVASIAWKGPWSDATIHRQFKRVVSWARAHRLRTGRWIFREPADRTWEVAVEVHGAAHAEGPVKLKRFRAGWVASVVYDPELVSPEVVYHGLSDWLRWRRRDGTIRAVSSYREVYTDDPWQHRRAFQQTEVQFVVRRGRKR